MITGLVHHALVMMLEILIFIFVFFKQMMKVAMCMEFLHSFSSKQPVSWQKTKKGHVALNNRYLCFDHMCFQY